MKNFKDGGFKKGGNKFGGKPKFGGGFSGGDRGGKPKFGGGGGYEKRPAELFPARCSTCGKNCEVPFRPSSDKPVYCSACFNKKNDDATREYHASKGGDTRRDDYRSEAPQRTERPVRHEMTRVQGTPGTGGIEEMRQKLDKLESKINRILEIVNQPKQTEKVSVQNVVAVPEKNIVKEVPAKNMTKIVVAKKAEAKPVAKEIKKEAVKAPKPVAKKVAAKPVVVKKAVKKVVAKKK